MPAFVQVLDQYLFLELYPYILYTIEFISDAKSLDIWNFDDNCFLNETANSSLMTCGQEYL